MGPILLASLAVMAASLLGVIFTNKVLKRVINKHLGLLVSFSAGVFTVVVVGLLQEVFAHSETVVTPVLWTLAGAIGVFAMFKLLPGFHHHHSDEQEDHEHSHIDARRIVVSDAIHNIGDGILLAGAFAVSTTAGIAVAISIFIHEAIQEISEFFVLREAGYSTKKALAVNFAASASLLIGSIGGFFLLKTFSALEIPLLAISAGAFIVVVLHDLVPESIANAKSSKKYIKYIIAAAAGIAIMFGVQQALGHSHSHEGYDHDTYDHGHESHDHEDDGEHGHDEHKDDHEEDDHHDNDHEHGHDSHDEEVDHEDKPHEGRVHDHDSHEDHDKHGYDHS